MNSNETVYRYKIPLDKSGEVDRPTYKTSGNGEVLDKVYTGDHVVMVQTKPSPHYHRDSVNVQVEEVDKSEYEN